MDAVDQSLPKGARSFGDSNSSYRALEKAANLSLLSLKQENVRVVSVPLRWKLAVQIYVNTG